MFKRIFAVLTALVMLVAAAGVSRAETAVTEKTAGLTIEDIKARTTTLVAKLMNVYEVPDKKTT